MIDLLLKGGTIVDGTGAPSSRGDIGIKGGKIVSVGEESSESARRTIDISGLVVAPGFIDIHTHYDAQVFWDPSVSPSMQHGVTTIVGGNCGFTIAPMAPAHADYISRMLAEVEGMPLQTLQRALNWDWTSFASWTENFSDSLVVNAGFLVGHSTIRRLVMGPESIERHATEAEVKAMAEILDTSIREGGLGFSSSWGAAHFDGDMNPVPSRSSDQGELTTLAAVAGQHPGTVLEFIPDFDQGLEGAALDVLVAMSLAADRPINWNLLRASDRDVEQKLHAADVARDRGAAVVALTPSEPLTLRVSLAAGQIFNRMPLFADLIRLPISERIAALSDPDQRARLRERTREAELTVNQSMLADWGGLRITQGGAEEPGVSGRLVREIAAERQADPFDVLLDIAIADELKTSFELPPIGNDDQAWRQRAELWRDPRTMVGGSDSGAHVDLMFATSYTTTLLGEGVRERELVSLEEAVHYLTQTPAQLYGLRGRGALEVGYQADVVVFDPNEIRSGTVRIERDLPAGAARLFAQPEGISYVIVNGVQVYGDGLESGSSPGQLLQSGRDTETVTSSQWLEKTAR